MWRLALALTLAFYGCDTSVSPDPEGGGTADTGTMNTADGTAGEAGSGGVAGEAGEAGEAGTAGSAGNAGSGGSAGAAGSAGSAGSAGTGGAAGSGGGAGSGGDAGEAGAAGIGGEAGEAGSAGMGGEAGVPGPACEAGASETEPCGFNGRADRSRTCDEGAWSEWTECLDIDVCTDETTDALPCGLNGTGEQNRTCVDGQWGEVGPCMDDAECVNGAREVTPCGSNQRGVAERTCQDGAWGELSECDDPDECIDDTIDSEDCGAMNNGQRRRTCVGGQWTIFSPCEDPVEACGAGEIQDVPCGLNGRALIERSCADGVWQVDGECQDADVCVDGALRIQNCGRNQRGRQESRCVRGQWSDFEACEDFDVCVDGANESEICGLNDSGTRSRVCAGGQWAEFGACLNDDVCENGSVLGSEVCGLNGRGLSGRACEEGQWTDIRCVDPDVCTDDENEERGCGRGGEGDQSRTCVEGQWSEWTNCANAWICPDPENPECGPAGRETCNGLDEDHDGVVDEGLIPGAEGEDEPMDIAPPNNDGECVGTPFACDVNAAIERGLDHLRNLEQGQGHLGDNNGRHNFLAVLALLEHRVQIPGLEQAAGYGALSLADQRMVVRLVRTLIDNEEAMVDSDAVPYTYVVGGNLAALSAYINSGGPNNVGAEVTVRDAITNGVRALHRVQADFAPNNLGGWNYRTPVARGDLSTTHFAVLGLSAAASVVEAADNVLPRVAVYIESQQRDDGGSVYDAVANQTELSSSAMTAAALRIYRRIGVPAGDPRAQESLRWLLQNWTFDGVIGDQFNPTGVYYYFWAVQHALSMSSNDGIGGAVYAEDFGERDPAGAGYPEEERSAYFDLAYTLLQWQDDDGAWGTQHDGSPRGWTIQSSHLFALLTLRSAGMGIIANESRVPECADEVDNDGDGQIDLDDPDCFFACTPYESSRAACSNLLDDDEDGLIDFPADLGCAFPEDNSEDNPPTHACANLLDDDEDGLVDFPEDPGCLNPADSDETDPECSNGVDDDDDGRVDYPIDPGCERFDDLEEADDPDDRPACFDDEDNDEDGLIDFPIDVGCISAGDASEVDLCGQGVEVEAYPVGIASILTNTANAGRNARGSCGGESGPDKIFVYDNPINANITVSVNYPDTIEGTGVYVRRTCDDDTTEIGCEMDAERAEISLSSVPPGPIYIYLDHSGDRGGDVRLGITATRLPAGCSDGRDNDADGFTDLDDPGCADEEDVDERDPESPAQCADGEDNDEDGIIDFPFEPGCGAQGDDSEEDPDELSQCANGLDDDQNGAIDFPNDLGCSSRGDNTEVGSARRPECANSIDDDANGLVDYPADPGCSGFGDRSERTGDVLPECADGEDNDEDGVIDYPLEPGCIAAGDPQEEDPVDASACSNGEDDDGDGLVDFPFEPGCISAGDTDETDPLDVPQCANGEDDDENGRTDYPDDPGCASTADPSENFIGEVPPRCFDGVDNDVDGLLDFEDPGCISGFDDDEADPEIVPACADQIDNDDDGATDWPEDRGCRAQGDLCEQVDFELCGDTCVDHRVNRDHCGECDNVCALGAECINGICGGFRCDQLRQVQIVPPNGGFFNIDTRGQPSTGTSCGGGGPQSALAINLEQARTVTVEITQGDYDTYLHLRADCDALDRTLECDDDDGEGLLSRISRRLGPGIYYAIIDGFQGRSGRSTVRVTIAP